MVLSPPVRTNPPSPRNKAVVFMDASAVFLAARDLHGDAQLNYDALRDLLRRSLVPSHGEIEIEWVLWTSLDPSNQGQVKFLEHMEKRGWKVRSFHPAESFMVDPLTLGASAGSIDSRTSKRLTRFDASIAFAIGYTIARDEGLARQSAGSISRIAVISDSFALAEPLVRAARVGKCRNAIAFFGRLLDPRWRRLETSPEVHVIDLDQFDNELFGPKQQERKEWSAWTDDFLTGR